MDKSKLETSFSANNQYKFARRKFSSWATQWAFSDTQLIQGGFGGLDVMDIVNLLRALGFKLRCYDRCSPEDVTPLTIPPGTGRGSGCRVVLSCDTSGLRIILEGSGSECRCPDINEDKEGSWQVTGSVPAGSQETLTRMDTAGSSVLSNLNPGVSAISPEIITKLLDLLTESSNDSRNISNTSSRRYSLSNIDSATNKSLTRYRSLDALTTRDQAEPILPNPLPLSEIQGAMKSMGINRTGSLQNRRSTQTKYPTSEPPPLIRQSTWTSVRETSSPVSFNQFFAEDKDAVIFRLKDVTKQLQIAIKSLQNSNINFANTSAISAIDGPAIQNLSCINEPNTTNQRKSLPLNQSLSGSLSHPMLYPTKDFENVAPKLEPDTRRTLSNLSAAMRRQKVNSIGLKSSNSTMTNSSSITGLVSLPPIAPKRGGGQKRPLCTPDGTKKFKYPVAPSSGGAALVTVQAQKKRDLGTKCTSFSGLPLTPRPQSNIVSKLALATKRLTPNALLKNSPATARETTAKKQGETKKDKAMEKKEKSTELKNQGIPITK